MSKTKIIIVDDHDITLYGLASYIEKIEHVEIVGKYTSAENALDELSKTKPDIVVTDVDMPDMDGVEFLKHIRKDYNKIKVIACTMHIHPWVIQKLLNNQADGIISKSSMRVDVNNAIEGALAGKAFYSSDVYEAVMHIMKRPNHEFNEYEDFVLTKREKQILQLIAEEYTTAEMAEKLFLSPNTIETHRKNLFLKFDVKNVAGLIRKAMERMMIE